MGDTTDDLVALAKEVTLSLIHILLFAVLIAGYLINKLYEINYFVSDTYFYLGMVLAVIIYLSLIHI